MFYSIFSVSLAMSAIILILIIVSPFINKHYSASWCYFAWLFVALRLVFPFEISLPDAPVQLPAPTTVVIGNNSGLPSSVTDGIFEMPNHQIHSPTGYKPVNYALADKGKSVSIHELLLIIWSVGVATFFLYHVISYMIFIIRIKKSCVPSNISSRLTVMKCRRIATPMLVGFFRPVILIPDASYTHEELNVILSHEITHFKRGDLWYKLLLVIVNSLHWFNPFVYAMVHYANIDLELSCDNIVVKNKDMAFRKTYSATILNSTHREKSTALSTYFGGGKKSLKSLKSRIANILDMSKKKKGIFAGIILAICTLSAGLLISMQNNSADNTTGLKADLTEKRLASLANQNIGASMATLDYADDRRVILHYSYALIVYDLENQSIHRMLDLEKLNIPYNTQGAEVIRITVNSAGTEIFISTYSKSKKSFIYNIENLTIEETSGTEYGGTSFGGLKATTELTTQGYVIHGWISHHYVQLDSSVCYLLLTDSSVDTIKIVLDDKTCNKKQYTVFNRSGVTEETAILLKDTLLLADMEGNAAPIKLKKNDLVYMIYDQNNEFYYVQAPVKGGFPAYGYIAKDILSFDWERSQQNFGSDSIELIPHNTNLLYTDLQREVDNGHYPWRLDLEQTALDFIHSKLQVVEGKIVDTEIAGDRASVTFQKTDGSKIFITLTKPVKKDRTGIWVADMDQYSYLKTELSAYPADYKPEDAVKDGFITVVDDKLLSGDETLKTFIDNSNKGIPGEIATYSYFEGGMVLGKIVYDGTVLYGVSDNTRHASEDDGDGYGEFSYRYIKVFEGNTGLLYVCLLDDNSVTFETLMKSFSSSLIQNHIPSKFILTYDPGH